MYKNHGILNLIINKLENYNINYPRLNFKTILL